jgi:hypothetical protein
LTNQGINNRSKTPRHTATVTRTSIDQRLKWGGEIMALTVGKDGIPLILSEQLEDMSLSDIDDLRRATPVVGAYEMRVVALRCDDVDVHASINNVAACVNGCLRGAAQAGSKVGNGPETSRTPYFSDVANTLDFYAPPTKCRP